MTERACFDQYLDKQLKDEEIRHEYELAEHRSQQPTKSCAVSTPPAPTSACQKQT